MAQVDLNTSFFTVLGIVSMGILISFVICFLIANKYSFNVSVEKEKVEVTANYSNQAKSDLDK